MDGFAAISKNNGSRRAGSKYKEKEMGVHFALPFAEEPSHRAMKRRSALGDATAEAEGDESSRISVRISAMVTQGCLAYLVI